MKILGIDPGFDRTGWAVVEKKKGFFYLLDCGIILTHKDDKFPARLFSLEKELTEVITKSCPEIAIVERLFFFKNVTTAIDVAQARGVIMLTCQKYCQQIFEPTPMEIKQAATGDGHASKQQVEKMIRLQIKNVPAQLLDDTIDAVAATFAFWQTTL